MSQVNLRPKTLLVQIEKCQFQKPNYYFITLDITSQSDPKRTDISPAETNPQFLADQFEFEIKNGYIQANDILKLECHAAGHGNDSVLVGETEVTLADLNLQDNQKLSQRIKFTKVENYKLRVIGSFQANFTLIPKKVAEDQSKIVKQYEMQEDFTFKNTKQFQNNSEFNQMSQTNDQINNSKNFNTSKKTKTDPNLRIFNNLSRFHLPLDENGQPIIGDNKSQQQQQQQQLQNSQEQYLQQLQQIQNNNGFGQTVISQQNEEIEENKQQIQSQNNNEFLNISDQMIRDFEDNQMSESNQTTISDILGTKLDGISDKMERWKVLSKELGQKMEMNHRMHKEIEEKTKGIKETGEEIVELRKVVRNLENQNRILKKRVYAEEQIKLHTAITPDVYKMSLEEIKNRIINVAVAYRDERQRNEDFEAAMREAEKDIKKIAGLEQELEDLREEHQKGLIRFQKVQEEVSYIKAAEINGNSAIRY
ncbi:hypothetical protein PPERSA_11833 [Pseudocohnilembus persalinus]|uniref:C2 domain n=1 Tax=Pseudocohnilembus persalinus TaxID=266149 RepID=A0A0V0QJN1_PSEPJ|nr:hypothetical protein PPERSA_11833 [Pseudocohnilembus persalinus]|eukprot:KRX02493.1 hypothetical protein PPERSA_11833 [Pseudocohnilembus persalinus]